MKFPQEKLEWQEFAEWWLEFYLVGKFLFSLLNHEISSRKIVENMHEFAEW